MVIAIDFDGTIVEHEYPQIGRERPFATATIRKLIEERHQIILWTVRSGELLQEAVDWCKERGIEFYAVNKSYPEEEIGKDATFNKVNAEIFIDDRNLGGIPDWGTIYRMINEKKDWHDICTEQHDQPKKKKKWLW